MRALAVALVLATVAASARAECRLFTVGPGGTHTTIQSAVDAALAGSGCQEIRVASATFAERLVIRAFPSHASHLIISGGYGWGAGFDRPPEGAARTVVDADRLGIALVVESDETRVVLRRIDFTGGAGTVAGGAWVRLDGHGSLTLGDVALFENRTGGSAAAGLDAVLEDDTEMWILDSRISLNRSEASAGTVAGGARILASGSSYVSLASTDFRGNEARALKSAEVVGSALQLYVSGSAGARVEDGFFLDNRSISDRGGPILALARLDTPAAPSFIEARRNRVLGSGSGAEPQVYLEQSGPGQLVFSDGIVALGSGPAIRAGVAPGAEAHLTNLTIADNGGPAVEAPGLGTTYLSNSILFGNGGDVSGVTETHNLREDPLFVNAAEADYHLRPGSPAVDAGDGAPPGGLGPLDVDRGSRRRGRAVDIGADEGVCPEQGPCREPACTVLPFAGASTPVCRCVSEPSLRHARCGALLDDLLLNVRIPLDAPPLATVPVSWTILPVGPVTGAYSMSAALFDGGQWQPQTWLGPTAVALKDGQLVQEPFVWKLPGGGAAPVRTRLKFTRPGAAEPSEAVIEVALPEPPK